MIFHWFRTFSLYHNDYSASMVVKSWDIVQVVQNHSSWRVEVSLHWTWLKFGKSTLKQHTLCSMVITYVYAKNSAPRADRGFLNDVQNTSSNCDITMWAGIYNFLMHRGACFDWNYFLKDYKMQTYWSHGAPSSTRDLIPWMWKYIICMNDNRKPNGHFS